MRKSDPTGGFGMIVFSLLVAAAAMTVITGSFFHWVIIIPAILASLSATKALRK